MHSLGVKPLSTENPSSIDDLDKPKKSHDPDLIKLSTQALLILLSKPTLSKCSLKKSPKLDNISGLSFKTLDRYARLA